MKWLYLFLLATAVVAQQDGIRFPAEWEPHERTFMCWPQSAEIWITTALLQEVRKDVAGIANAIVAQNEPVVMFVDPMQGYTTQGLLDDRVTIVEMKLDDLWARDTLPVFVEKTTNGLKELVGVIFNFNGWGKKQYYENDAKLAQKVVDKYRIEGRIAKIVAEGGSFETDGQGTLLVTESSLVNTNRNGREKAEIEIELKAVLGVEKVIWFKGVKNEDITDAHVDCLVRFVKPGTVIINRPSPGSPPNVWSKSSDDAFQILKNSTDANKNKFEIIEIFEANAPDGAPKTYLPSYANFLIGNGFVIVPVFGDKKADLAAQAILRQQFKGREIVPVPIGALAGGGGGIHCATHDMPAIKQKLQLL